MAYQLSKKDIVIYESTVYPGCTEEDCVPILEKKSGLKFKSSTKLVNVFIVEIAGVCLSKISPLDNAISTSP